MMLGVNGNFVCPDQMGRNNSSLTFMNFTFTFMKPAGAFIQSYTQGIKPIGTVQCQLSYRNTWEITQSLAFYFHFFLGKGESKTLRKQRSKEVKTHQALCVRKWSPITKQPDSFSSTNNCTLKPHRLHLHCLGFHIIFRSREKSDKISHPSFRWLLC